jgi:hypothetical protein
MVTAGLIRRGFVGLQGNRNGPAYVTCGYTQLAYNEVVKGVFVELPAFERHRADYLDDHAFLALQNLLMSHPEAGELIPDAGGLRKLRFADVRRGKGKRGGLRVIYYWWVTGLQFWLFTLYDKGEMADLTPSQRRALKAMIKTELRARRGE